MVKGKRSSQRSFEQVYALEGWRGVAKRMPSLKGRTDSAKRSAVYRTVRGYPGKPKQQTTKADRTAINRRAGRLLARKTARDSQGRVLVDEEGEPIRTPISPQNNAKLAIHRVNTERLEARRDAKARYEAGEIQKEEYELSLEANARLTPAQRQAFYDQAEADDWDSFRASYGSASGEL